MFDAEKLLGKVLSGVMDSSDKKSKKGKKSKKSKKSKVFNSMGSQLMSGKGLITAIGLGVGAYEILKSKQTSSQQSYGNQISPVPGSVKVPPQLEPTSSSTAPPPLPGNGKESKESVPLVLPGGEQALAMRFIQVMVAAAYADGSMDEDEEKQILGRMQEQGLSSEEKNYILAELHSPKNIDELAEDLSTPQLAQMAYSLAVSTVVVDSDSERKWLDELAGALSISTTMQGFIEEHLDG